VSAEFDEVPSAVWDALAWFLGVTIEMPVTGWVQAAVSVGFLHPQAVGWVISRRLELNPDKPKNAWKRLSDEERRKAVKQLQEIPDRPLRSATAAGPAWLTLRGKTAWLRYVDRLEAAGGASAPPPPAPPPPARLAVNLECRTLTLDGETYDVDSVQALRWVRVLAERPGEWVSGADLSKYDPELDGARPDKLKKPLPGALLSLINSETGKGSRLRL
jgi:hypothetical protein